jgi:hypothetical protein
LIPFYGYYKDYFLILDIIKDRKGDYKDIVVRIFDLVYNQLIKDMDYTSEYKKFSSIEDKPKLSLLAKYIPKEGKHFDKSYNFVEMFVKKYFLKSDDVDVDQLLDAKKKYRKYVSKLNEAINTPEIKMSAKKFAEINFSNISSKCVFKYRKAFLNEILIKKDKEFIERYEDPDRKSCRNNFIDAIKLKKIKGKQLELYEITKVVMNKRDNFSEEEVNLFQVQWEDAKKDIINKIKNGTSLINSKLLPIVDVSGSMHGIPMYVAVILGILLTEINEEPLKDKFITFSETPTWVNLSSQENIVEKIEKVLDSKWGTSTNFEAVYDMILDIVLKKKLSQDQIPDLVVLSDMQFNEARGVHTEQDNQWTTHHELITKKFRKVGEKVSGTPYDPPKIVYWNLRADTLGFPVQAHTPDVKMLSGFSPNLFKHILAGEDISKFPMPTPYSTLRNILDDDRYDIIKEIVFFSKELEKIENLIFY